jgi:dTDP-4-amino-4,6-dideoxygalactose transaminase
VKVPFLNIHSQYQEIKPAAQKALKALWQRSDFILGADVRTFEEDFARYVGAKYALGVNSGTDALFLGLLSLGIKPGDEVIVPVYTYIASAFAVTYTGARPVFVDIDKTTFNIHVDKIEKAITAKTKAIMPVHLYGQAADMGPILEIARRRGIRVIEDAAQAHGTLYRDRKAGALGDIGAFSFYPTKNLGAFGDAGMLVTNDPGLYEKLKKLRDYGRTSRYEHDSIGYNSRLDGIQAVFLREKLKRLDRWNKKRREAAGRYRQGLKNVTGIRLPQEASYGGHVYHIFAVRLKNRDGVLKRLRDAGIGAMVHYPVPLHLQQVYAFLGYKPGDFPIAEQICREVLCLPIFPHIKDKEIDYVIKILSQEEKG